MHKCTTTRDISKDNWSSSCVSLPFNERDLNTLDFTKCFFLPLGIPGVMLAANLQALLIKVQPETSQVATVVTALPEAH